MYSGICMQGYAGDDQLAEALKGADVVIMPAGVPRKPGMTRDDLFKVRCFEYLWRQLVVLYTGYCLLQGLEHHGQRFCAGCRSMLALSRA